MNHDVFISYSSKDKEVADAAYNVLQKNGVRCWIDTQNILPGQSYGGEIIRAIRNCQIVVLVFSANADGSKDVLNEIERAKHHGKHILPWRIDDIEPCEDMEYLLARRQWLSALDGPTEANLQRLVASVKHYLPEAASDIPAVALPSSSPLSRQGAPIQNESKETQKDKNSAVPSAAKIQSVADGQQDVEDEENVGKFDYTRKTNRTEFLAACHEEDREYFTQVLDHCQSNSRKTIVEWGSKGFSLKDRNERPLIWMFPTRGTQWTIQTRTQRYSKTEKEKVTQLLAAEGIKGISWRPNDLPFEKMKEIINLLCRIKTD